MKRINRLKIALVEQDKTGKWLAETIGKDVATVSRWCSNATQPSLGTLVEIAKVLDMDIRDLLVSTKK
jgi:transcriptional regulator with XRE-family HTH domain